MKILSWNVNGIRSQADKGFIEWVRNEAPDILCVQETKAHPEQLGEDIISPGGYFSCWNNPSRKGYAGVAVYSKKKPEKIEKDFISGTLDTEGRTLILYFKDIVLINVNFPNGRSGPERLRYKLEFYDRFLDFVDSLERKDIVICGDVNTAHKAIDLARPQQNKMFSGFLPEEREWMDKFVEHGFIDTFRHFNKEPDNYTWWDYKSRARERNVGWRIDYFFVSKEMISKVKDAFIMPDVMGSDHCPIGIDVDVK